MMKIIIVKYCILLAVLYGSAYAQQLKNPSFEDADDPDNWFSDQADRWGRWGNWINRETGWSPTHSGECLVGYHHWRIEEATSSGIYQDIPDAPAGQTYTFSIYTVIDPGTNIKGVELRLEPLGGGAVIASSSFQSQHFMSKWKPISVTGKILEKGLRVVIIITPEPEDQRSGAIKFDDASLLME